MQMRGDPYVASSSLGWGSAHKQSLLGFLPGAPERDRGEAIPGHPLNRCIESLDKK